MADLLSAEDVMKMVEGKASIPVMNMIRQVYAETKRFPSVVFRDLGIEEVVMYRKK